MLKSLFLFFLLTFIIPGLSGLAYAQETHPLLDSPVHDPPVADFDQEHVRLALRFEPEAGRIFGVAKLRIKPLSDSLNTLVFSAQNLDVYSVQIGVLDSLKIESPYSDSTEGIILIQLDSLQARGVPFEVQITYTASPKAGMYFKKISPSDTSHQVHIWTDNALQGLRFWIPLLNNPVDQLTSEIIATVPPSLNVLSNGRMIQHMETEDGMSLYHYVQDQPHAQDNIGLFIGRFLIVEQQAQLKNGFTIPVKQWVSAKTKDQALQSLEEVPDLMSFISEKLDFTYPWPAYSQLIFDDPFIDDMSFSGFTIFNDRVLIDKRAAIDQPNTFSVATSVARQWYGHLISADHWSDIWITESLSRFIGLMYIKSIQGDAAYYTHLNQMAKAYFEEAGAYQRPLVWNRWHAPSDLLDQHTVGKGVWFFHTLYKNLGEEKFWEYLQTFTREHAFQATNTDQLLASLMMQSDGQFDGFFDNWVYSAGHPQFKLDYQYDVISESLYVSIEQLQEGYLVPPVFELDLQLETYTLSGPVRHQIALTERDQLFSFPMAIQPRYVELDPDHTMLASIQVGQSASAWVSQLRYASHPLSQLEALENLRAYTDDPALFIGLENALKSRPIPEVRADIITLIAMLPPSDATKRTLLETYEKDDSPLVKRAVLQGLELYESQADLIILAMDAAQTAQSYLLQAQAVATLIKIGAPNAFDIFQSALITPSYRDVIRQTALRALEHTALTTREKVKLALDYSRPRHAVEVRLAAMEILASMAALQNKQSLTALIDLLNDKQMVIQQSASAYLGNIGAANELSALKKQLGLEYNPRVVTVLEEAIRTLESRSETTNSP